MMNYFKNLFNIKIFINLLLCILVSGCYSFAKKPYNSSDLISITNTELGMQLLENKNKFNSKELKDQFDGVDNNLMVREISKNYIIYQKKNKENNWDIGVLMRSSDHLIICMPMTNEELKIPSNITIAPNASNPLLKILDGKQSDLRKFADLLMTTQVKICSAVPVSGLSANKNKDKKVKGNFLNILK